jgi:hypothetical protein
VSGTTAGDVIVQVWTAPACEIGARAIAPLPVFRDDVWTDGRDDVSTGALTLTRTDAAAAGVSIGRVVRWVSPVWGTREWVVTSVTDGAGAGDDERVRVTMAPIRALLGLRGLVRAGVAPARQVLAFTPVASTIAQLLEAYVLSNAAADGLGWLSVGTIEFTQPITIPPFAAATRGDVVRAIEQATRTTMVMRAIGTTGYAMDFVIDRGATAPVLYASMARAVTRVARTADAVRAPTAVVPVTAAGAAMGDTAWRIVAKEGTAPAWLSLRDPAYPDRSPITVPNLLVGAWVRRPGGQTALIEASRVSDSAVRVADGASFSVGDQVTFAQDATGTPLFVVVNDTARQQRGIITATVTVPASGTARNLLEDPLFQSLGTRWTAPSNLVVSAWDRDGMAAVGEIDTPVSSGATTLPVTGFPPNYRVVRGQSLLVQATSYQVASDTLGSGTGTATVPITPVLAGAIAGDARLEWRRGMQAIPLATPLTDGTQALGASSLVLKGLPPSPAWLSGDTLTDEGESGVGFGLPSVPLTASAFTATLATPLPYDVRAGAVVQLGVSWRVRRSRVRFVNFVVTESAEGTVTAPAAAGSSTLSVTFPTRQGPIYANDREYSHTLLGATLALLGVEPVTYGVVGVPTFNASGEASVTVTPVLSRGLLADTNLTWRRAGGALVGSVIVPTAVANGVGTFSVDGSSVATVLRAGDRFELPAERLYANADTVLSGAGAGTVPLEIATAGALPAGADVVAEHPPEFGNDRPGGPIVLGLRGPGTALLESETFLVPAGTTSVTLQMGTSFWSATGNVTPVPVRVRLFDPVTLATYFDATTSTGNVPPADGSVLHRDEFFVSLSGRTAGDPIRLQLSAAPVLGQHALFRWVMVTAPLGSKPFVILSESNVALLAGAEVLAAAAGGGGRFEITGAAVPQWLDTLDTPPVVGQRVRLRLDPLDVDATVRVASLTWSFKNPDVWRADLSAVPPRLSSVSVSV